MLQPGLLQQQSFKNRTWVPFIEGRLESCLIACDEESF
jgi:hypothetical protein